MSNEDRSDKWLGFQRGPDFSQAKFCGQTFWHSKNQPQFLARTPDFNRASEELHLTLQLSHKVISKYPSCCILYE